MVWHEIHYLCKEKYFQMFSLKLSFKFYALVCKSIKAQVCGEQGRTPSGYLLKWKN